MLGDEIFPQAFSAAHRAAGADAVLSHPQTRQLAEFFEAKGLSAIKDEDQREQWYEDWLAYQASHRIYASILAPRKHAAPGFAFDLLSYARFLEVFAYYSPAHGYSLQVTFLGLMAIHLGDNDELKQEAMAVLNEGGLLAFGISEQGHGSDLLANEFCVAQTAPGRFVANGSKYYIGNANCASIMAILARNESGRGAGGMGGSGQAGRTLPVLFAFRPRQFDGLRNLKKIRTLGVRSAFVGSFEVRDHEFPEGDIIAQGRGAWDAVTGAVTLGKFFLNFGSIGICEHALEEAAGHLNRRILYGKPAMELPHLRFAVAQAYARLTAMKLYAYRALDYLHAAGPDDRRYILYCAVQKAKVSTEGVKVMAQLSECIGAKGFESDTYFEMALRDIQLFPGLEGSTHINLALTARFIPQYFASVPCDLSGPASLAAGQRESDGNPFLTQAHRGAIQTIAFAHFRDAYEPLASIANVRLFAGQAEAFHLFLQNQHPDRMDENLQANLLAGRCLASIAYAQLIAENSVRLGLPAQMVSVIFHLLVIDLAEVAMAVASSGQFDPGLAQTLVQRTSLIPQTAPADWDFVSKRVVR